MDDDGRLKSLHGRVQNIPASVVSVTVDEEPPHAIHVLGRVDERTFKMSELVTWTQLSVVPGQAEFAPQGQADQPRGLRERVPDHLSRQLRGTHSWRRGARVSTPVKQISPVQ